MKKSLLTVALILGACASIQAQVILPSTDKLIDEMGNQFKIETPDAFFGEELYMNSQGKVTRANGNVVGFATNIGTSMQNNHNIDDIISGLGGSGALKKMAGI